MPRKNPPARWVLPESVDPATRRCFTIDVPDDPAHIAAFRGALLALASAYNWSDDPTHKAREVALVWRGIIDSHLDWGCAVQTQIREDDACTLSWSYDEWVTFNSYDPAVCIQAYIDSLVPGMITDGIQQAILDGLLQQKGGQPSPGGTPNPETCKTMHVILRANERWHCPFPINDGWTIAVDHIEGGWSDGTPAWYCSTGGRYLLTACVEDMHSHEAGDPSGDGWHMELIGQINLTYFTPGRATYTVPNATGTSYLDFLANDGSLSDNSGQIEFDVTICAPAEAPTWCYTFDFLTTDGGWSNYDGNVTTWTLGYGWVSAQYFGIKLDIGTGPDFQITDISMTYWTYGPRSFTWSMIHDGTDLWGVAINTGQDYHYDPKLYFPRPLEIRFVCSDARGVSISGITIHGTGVCPFGDSNC